MGTKSELRRRIATAEQDRSAALKSFSGDMYLRSAANVQARELVNWELCGVARSKLAVRWPCTACLTCQLGVPRLM
jgi:hypothetical protein